MGSKPRLFGSAGLQRHYFKRVLVKQIIMGSRERFIAPSDGTDESIMAQGCYNWKLPSPDWFSLVFEDTFTCIARRSRGFKDPSSY
jgi:hypothetical protein